MPGASGDYGSILEFSDLGRTGIINDYGSVLEFDANGIIDFNYMSRGGPPNECTNSSPLRNSLNLHDI